MPQTLGYNPPVVKLWQFHAGSPKLGTFWNARSSAPGVFFVAELTGDMCFKFDDLIFSVTLMAM